MSDFPVIHLQPGGANPPTPTQKSNILASLGAAAAAHTHAQVDVTGLTTALQALTDAVGARATTSSIVDNLLSTDAAVPLSANQGRVLKGLIDSITALLASDDVNLDELQEIVDYIQLNRADLEALSIASIAGLQNALDELQDSLDLKSPYPDAMVVEGAGTTSVNTVYLRDGSLIGKPRYTRIGGVTDDDSIKAAANPAWAIYLNGSEQYFSNDASDTPDQVTTWDVTGDPPAPTVRRATWSDYIAALTATKAQGVLAASAVQPGDLEPIPVLTHTARRDPATYAPDGVVVGVTEVVVDGEDNKTYYPVALDVTTDANWRYRIDAPAGEDLLVNLELSPMRGSITDKDTFASYDGNAVKGDGNSRGRTLVESNLPKGYVELTYSGQSQELQCRTNGDAGATGFCYSINGGAPVYVAGTTKLVAFTGRNTNGAIERVSIWSAISATSGVVGTIKDVEIPKGTIFADLSNVSDLTTPTSFNAVTTLAQAQQIIWPTNLSSLSTLIADGASLSDLSFVSFSAMSELIYRNCTTRGDFTAGTASLTTSFDLSGSLFDTVTATNKTMNGYCRLIGMPNLVSVDISGTSSPSYGAEINNNPELLSLDISNSSVGYGVSVFHSNPKLESVTANNFVVSTPYGTSYHSLNLSNCNLDTDAVWSMINGLGNAIDDPAYIKLLGNPCDDGLGGLVAGATYNEADVQALLTAKGYSVILTGGTLVP